MTTKTWLFLLLSAGCGVIEGSDDPRLLVPLDVELRWERAFNQSDDDLVAVVPVDIMVYGQESGQPYGNEVVEIEVMVDGVSPHSPESLAPPYSDECADCEVVWDSYRDLLLEWQEPTIDKDQHVISVMTDKDGLARAFIIVDSVEVQNWTTGTGFDPFEVMVRIEGEPHTSDSFLIIPR